jgi:hypothetical protein
MGTWPFSGDAAPRYLMTLLALAPVSRCAMTLTTYALLRPTHFPSLFKYPNWPLLHRKGEFSPPTHQPNAYPPNHILTMKFPSTIPFLAALFSVTSADIVRYNTIYDNPSFPLNDVACSNGANGLVTAGFATLGKLPTFPVVGGVFAVSGWNSPECGSCWKLSYKGNSILVTAIDTISDGFDISLKAMNELTGGKAVALDSIDALATQIPRIHCGL